MDDGRLLLVAQREALLALNLGNRCGQRSIGQGEAFLWRLGLLRVAQQVDFELPSTDGGTFRLSDYRGEVVVVYFGYTSCPDVCPATLFDLKRAEEQLGERAEDVEVVFVTIDPEVDTPERINEYLNYFDESFIGTYGTEEQLQAVRDLFHVTVLRSDEGEAIPGYGITHTTSMFVINREGYLKLRMHHETDPELLARDLDYFIKGKL